jgi:hypothetical protein
MGAKQEPLFKRQIKEQLNEQLWFWLIFRTTRRHIVGLAQKCRIIIIFEKKSILQD